MNSASDLARWAYRPLIFGWLNRQGVPPIELKDLGQEVLLSLRMGGAALLLLSCLLLQGVNDARLNAAAGVAVG